MKKQKNRLFLHMLITGIMGAIFWIISELLLVPLFYKIWTPLAMAIYFLAFSVFIFILFVIFSFIKGDYNDSLEKRKGDTKRGYITVLIFMVILFFVTGLFEFIYEQNFYTLSRPTSYLFLIDDSGSMSVNDKNNERPKAISAVMADENDMEYAVYKFTDNAELIKPMSYYQPNDIQQIQFDSDGGTNILGGIQTVKDDILSDRIPRVGDHPRILLLSDGESSRDKANKILKECVDNNISISTVGFGDCDEAFLKTIAARTGGAYVYCDSAETLKDKIEGVIAAYSDRNLLSERYVPKIDWLYAVMRILFLSLMCVLWSFIKVQSLSEFSQLFWKAIRLSIICCIIANILLEILSALYFPIGGARLIFCILWATTLGRFVAKSKFKAQMKPIEGIANNSSGINDLDKDNLNNASKTAPGVDRIVFGSPDPQDNQTDDPPVNENRFANNPGGGFGSKNGNPFSAKGSTGGFNTTPSSFGSNNFKNNSNSSFGSSQKNNPFDQSNNNSN